MRCRLCQREIEPGFPGYVNDEKYVVYVTRYGRNMACQWDRHSDGIPRHELDTVELARELTQVLFS